MCLAVPGQILSIAGDDPLTRTGRVRFGGIVKEASLACVPEAEVGDYVLVHVGFAISKLDEEEAQHILTYLRSTDELAELEDKNVMKFVDEYRDADAAHRLVNRLTRLTTRSWTLMEVCGGQTHAILKFGIDELLPKEIDLIHGPGCPVCVTPVELLDKAIAIASRPDVVFCSFGDMLRVPGSRHDLLSVKAAGGDVRMVYSPLDALRLARDNPNRQVVFFAVGFETTVPATALAVHQAARWGVANFSLLVAHVLVPPAMETVLSSADNRVQGFLAAGHVCVVMGYREYEPIARHYRVPIVVTGFEPLDILQGIYLCVRQLEEGRAEVENQYTRAVVLDGNRHAQEILREVFRVVPRRWRGMGEIPRSGLALNERYAAFDAEQRFPIEEERVQESPECIAGLILQGVKKPHDCPVFGTACTPEHPFGAPMVSSEGACAAYYRYRRLSLGRAASPSPR